MVAAAKPPGRSAGSYFNAIRATPWRVCGSITGATCHTWPWKLRSEPTGVTVARAPARRPARSASDRSALISSSPPCAIRNSTPEPPLTTWPRLDLPGQHQPGGGRADVEAAVRRTLLRKLRLSDAHARDRGVARGGATVDIGAADKAVRDQRLGAVEIGLCKLRVSLRHPNLRGEAGRCLRLHTAVHRREHLARTDPLAWFHQHPRHAAAFADDAHRHLATRGHRAIGGDHAVDGLSARCDDGHGRSLLDRRSLRPGLLAVAAKDVPCAKQGEHHRHGDPHRPATAPRPLLARQRERIAVPQLARLVVHPKVLFPARFAVLDR
jgi:hypothetical protein